MKPAMKQKHFIHVVALECHHARLHGTASLVQWLQRKQPPWLVGAMFWAAVAGLAVVDTQGWQKKSNGLDIPLA